jgi:hypothetical protein
MSTISAHLRNFKEPDRDGQTILFFAIPAPPPLSPPPSLQKNDNGKSPLPREGEEKMEINAVLTLGVEGEEDAYVRPRAVCAVHERAC